LWFEPRDADGEVFLDPAALYTGSPICHDFGEAGHPHGVWIVDVELGSQSAEFVPIESRAFWTIDWAFGDDADLASLPPVTTDLMPDGAIVRLRYSATSAQQRRIDTHAITAALKAAGAVSVSIEPDIVREDRARVDGVHADLAPLDAYDLWATSGDLDPALGLRARVRLAEHLEAVA